MTTTLPQLKNWLTSSGFSFSTNSTDVHLFNDCNWYAYRKTSLDARECECNEGKRMQIIVRPSIFTIYGNTHSTVEVDIYGKYGEWWKFTSYGHSFEKFQTNLPQIEAGLIRAWNVLNVPEKNS